MYGFKKPTKHRTFRVSVKPGRRKFKAVRVQHTKKEVIYVAKKTKNKLSEEELEELEDLEDLEDLDDEDEDEEDVEEEELDEEDEDDDDDEEDDEDEDEDDEVEDDDEEDEEEEAPPKKTKSKKSTKKASKKGKSRASSDGRVGPQEIAAECGIDARAVRMVLRKHNIEKDEDSGRYSWSSMKHPEVRKVVKLIKEKGEAEKVKKEGLDKLKSSKTRKTKKKSSSKASSKKRKKSTDEDDE